MKAGTVLGLAVNAVAVGLALTLLAGDQRVISLEIWLASALAWAMLLAGRAMIRRVPTAPVPVLPILTRRSDDASAATSPKPKSLRAIEQVVAQSIDQPRIHVAQLQPRLQRLVAGRGSESVPDDLAWLLEPSRQRAPTLAEIDRLVDAVSVRRPHERGAPR